jgi:periplasmic protein CpxP/Spy
MACDHAGASIIIPAARFKDSQVCAEGRRRSSNFVLECIMNHSFRHSIIAAAAVIGLSGFAAIAAPAAGDPSAAGPRTTARPATGHETRVTIEERIKDMHAKLLISPAQQPQWDAFADVMRNNGRSMEQTFQQRVNTMSSMTAPENMQSYAQIASSHAQDMQKLVPAFQTLYDTMSDSQKKTADLVFRDEAHHGKHARHG